MVLPHVSKHFKYLPVKDCLLIAQKIDDPEEVFFYWDPYCFLAPFLSAIRDVDVLGKFIDAPPIQVKGRGTPKIWEGMRWTNQTDKVIKSLAEAFIDLRFASPERTQIMIQDDLWPEIEDGV